MCSSADLEATDDVQLPTEVHIGDWHPFWFWLWTFADIGYGEPCAAERICLHAFALYVRIALYCEHTNLKTSQATGWLCSIVLRLHQTPIIFYRPTLHESICGTVFFPSFLSFLCVYSIYFSLRTYLFNSIYESIYLSNYLTFYLSIFLSFYLPNYL